jgi:predicted AAA+ superfamily ATPase
MPVREFTHEPSIGFFRDSAGHEVDFVIDDGADVKLLEVKATSTFNPDFLKNIRFYRAQPSARVSQSCIVYTGAETFNVDDVSIVPISDIGTV